MKKKHPILNKKQANTKKAIKDDVYSDAPNKDDDFSSSSDSEASYSDAPNKDDDFSSSSDSEKASKASYSDAPANTNSDSSSVAPMGCDDSGNFVDYYHTSWGN